MKQLNNNLINSLHPWIILCVFSTTESHISKFFNITTSLFFTKHLNFVLDEELCTRLYSNNFKYIFDINENYHEVLIRKIDVGDNNSLIIYQGDLNSLLTNEELFKDVIDRKLINSSFFIFNNIKWKNICKKFLEKNIVISGGSSTRRHIMAPIHIKLILILTCLKFAYEDVVTSFNIISKNKEISMPKNDSTSPLPTKFRINRKNKSFPSGRPSYGGSKAIVHPLVTNPFHKIEKKPSYITDHKGSEIYRRGKNILFLIILFCGSILIYWCYG